MTGQIRISIVAACRNEAAHIASFLDSLAAQQLGGFDWEALVADGMSDDGTRDILQGYARRDSRLNMIDNPRRIVSTGLNAAILASRGDFILRMDAHTRYAPDYCRLCIETLIAMGADNAGGPARTEARGNEGRAIAAAYHSRFSTGGSKFHDEGFEGWVDTVPYGCWRRGVFDRIGMFDETLVRNQDDEFNLRLLRAGGRIWQNPRIHSWYSPRATLGRLFRQYLQYGFWKVAVIRKHRVPGSWRHLVPVSFVLANMALPALAGVAWISGHHAGIVGAFWMAMLAGYVLATVTASVVAARRSGWPTMPYLPVAFAAYHFSYGLGFLAGIVSAAGRRQGAGSDLFTQITRNSRAQKID